MTKKLPIILLNFADEYDYEPFASSRSITHVDCRDIKGADCYCDELMAQIPVGLRERLVFYSQEEIDHHQAWPSKVGHLIHEPVYLSIDKDVLRQQDAITNWSNGDMSLMQLKAVLRIIYAHEEVIGADITGEYSATLDYFTERKEALVDNKANEELMRMILAESQQQAQG